MESLNSSQEKKIWKATLYTRTSKGIQDDKSNTLVNQLSIITEYAKAQDDIEVCSVRSDNGFSGLNFNRPAYQEMWDDIKSGNINCIIVKDLSRFNRSHLGGIKNDFQNISDDGCAVNCCNRFIRQRPCTTIGI